MNLCNVAILAGGMGSRLKSRTGNLPKPMAIIYDKPVLEHQIDLCRRHGFLKIALLVHYESEVITNYFGDGSNFGVSIEYFVESEPRGTAGALRDALPMMEENFLVLYGDTYADVNLRKLWDHHMASGLSGLLFLHPNDHPHDSDLVEVDGNDQIIAVHPYPHTSGEIYRNLVNAALYVLNRETLKGVIPTQGKYDLAKNTFPAMLQLGISLGAYTSPEYIKDMGTPERLDKVERDITFGLPDRLSDRGLRSAVFLDRDGTLNVEVNHLNNPSQLVLLPSVSEAIRSINRSGLLAIGVTNQPVVARGEITVSDLGKIHAQLDCLLGQSHAYLDAIYFCPHHPDKGFQGEIVSLKKECDCRKPRTGLLDLAVKEFSIDRKSSWMIGDSTSDIEAGNRAGLRTILVRTGYAGLDKKYHSLPQYVVPDMRSAVNWILNGHKDFSEKLLEVCSRTINERLVLIGGQARSGKSSAAQVMRELISASGRRVHLISLDGWLYPPNLRKESEGVLGRYNMKAVHETLLPVLNTKRRQWINVPEYERKTQSISHATQYSIGPDDLIIVEGVTALVNGPLIELTNARIFMDATEEIRISRLYDEYEWRGKTKEEILSIIKMRNEDEKPLVESTLKNANYHILN
jgi:histidinol-phosphate phosphatase family protein